MPVSLNRLIGVRLDEVATLLHEQGAHRFRVRAYRRAAATVRSIAEPLDAILAREGLAGLQQLPTIGPSIARAIRDLILQGHLALLDRLRGEHDPIALLGTVPGIGGKLAERLHYEFGIDSLTDLEMAAYNGRLDHVAGLGAKRLAGVSACLARRLGRPGPPAPVAAAPREPTVAELLDVDEEYRRAAGAGVLKKIAPRHRNPLHVAWLPILHARRGERHYTVLFSNTARAHELKKTGDWVILYYDGEDDEHQSTIITAQFGPLQGRRIVRGREMECEAYYRTPEPGISGEPRGRPETAAPVLSLVISGQESRASRGPPKSAVPADEQEFMSDSSAVHLRRR